MTLRTSTTTSRRSLRRAIATSAFALLAVGSVASASFLPGAAPTAQADPGDTLVPIGTSMLVQSEDLDAIQVNLDKESVVLHQNPDFSSCLGEGNPWTAVLKGSPKPIEAYWTPRGHDDQSLTEFIAQAKSPAQAKRYAATLVNTAIRTCQDPKWDFNFGPLQSSRVGSGYATWALSHYGNHRAAVGGVVVVRKGDKVGFLEVNGTFGSADQTMESVAKEAVNRLA